MNNTQKTISAGGIILNQKGQVCVVSQRNSTWSFPKGHVEEGEDILVAAQREILEETGLTHIQLIKSFEPYTRYKMGKDGTEDGSELKELHFFLFTTEELTLKPIDPHNPEARWVEKEDVPGFLTHTKDKEFYARILPELML